MLSIFTGKISRMIFLCFIIGPRFPEMAEPWRPAHSIKATSYKSEIRSKFIHYSSILTLVGISRFISIVTSGNLLPNESITPRQRELESEPQSTENKLGRGAEPTWPCAHSSPFMRHWDNGQTSQRASTHPPTLGSSPRDLSIHIHNTQNRAA